MVISHKDSERIAVLEVRVKEHEDAIHRIATNQEELKNGLDRIHSTLMKIFYVMVGTGLTLIIQKYGIHDAVISIIEALL